MSNLNMTSQPPKGRNSARRLTAFRQWLRRIFRPFLAILGVLFIALSIPIGLASPLIPIGLPIGIIGVLLLGRNSTMGRNWMESVMAKRPFVERMAPKWLMRFVFEREKRDFSKEAPETPKS